MGGCLPLRHQFLMCLRLESRHILAGKEKIGLLTGAKKAEGDLTNDPSSTPGCKDEASEQKNCEPWMKILKDIASDVLDEFSLESMGQRMAIQNRVMSKMHSNEAGIEELGNYNLEEF
ncbi:hypothetical protein NE237_006027 [Protea cynaroides]|uniref:Uncharacterized protein n=1 Tax=Protea cynaroides TaxID=273540 RepID=A0A9Q0QUX6_9MAGN|nr:hypothetical protein NE237_006027 [Protea cynaroides]